MSIMGIGQALKLQKGSLQSIAQLPQDELIRMVQTQELPQTLLPIILDVKAQMAKDAANRQAMMAANAQGGAKTITEKNMATNAAAEAQAPENVGIATAPMRPDMFNEKEYAGGGIVAFDDGGEVVRAQSGLYVNPTFSEMIRKRETGGFRGDPNFAVSPKGAMGIMQIMPKTAMKPGFGVPTVFEIADQLGVSYSDKSEDSAKKLLTNPDVNKTFGDLYAGAMLQRFEGNPQLAAAAYNAGPGAVERAGGVPEIAETKKYVAGISPERMEAARKSVQEARREQLKDFSLAPTGKSIMPYRSVMEGQDKPPVDYEALMNAREPKAVTSGLGSTFDPYLEATKPTETGPTKEDVDARQQEFSDYLYGRRPITPASPQMAAAAAAQRAAEKKPEAAPAAPAESPFADFRKYIEGMEKKGESQRAEDRAMSILAAGLGILGGTSPYAFTNIGQGAMQGVALSSRLAQQRADREKDLLAARLGLSKAELMDKYYTGQLAARGRANQVAMGRLGAAMQSNLIRARKQFMDENGADKLAAEFEARYGKNWRKSTQHSNEYKRQMNEAIREIAGGMGMGDIPFAEDMID